MLKRIKTHDIEPTDLDVPLGPGLNLLAGDNGLGKTFLIDLAWWAMTGSWAQRPRWYRMYQEGQLSLEGLRKVAPLIAAAEEKRLAVKAAR
jgi:recombinational DNA repair ATPase RecF